MCTRTPEIHHPDNAPARITGAAAPCLAAAFALLMTTVPALADDDCQPSSTTDCPTHPAPQAHPALTAAFHGLPDNHDGSKLFSFELRFSENFPGRLRYKMLRDQAFQVTGGTVRVAKRVARGQNQRWTISVRPHSSADVTVTLPAGSVVTDAGRSLANPVSFTVPGPAPETPAPVAQPVSEPEPQTAAATVSSTPEQPEQAAATISSTPEPPTPNVEPDSEPQPVSDPEPESASLTATASSAPSGLPSGAGALVNLNNMGTWRAVQYQSGQVTNPQIDLELRKRNGPNSSIYLVTPCANAYTVPGRTGTWCSGTGADNDTGVAHGLRIIDRWYTYPTTTAAGMKVHVRVKKANDESAFAPGVYDLVSWVNQGYGYDEFFTVEAHLEAPGTNVQPTGTGSATWSGKVVGAYNPNCTRGCYFTRGDLIGGDASVTVNFGSSTTANVSLTNLKAATRLHIPGSGPQRPVSYSSQTWSGLAVSGGTFSHSGSGRSISGAFQDQNSGDSKQADTVGGVFAVNGVMKGGFVAERQ